YDGKYVLLGATTSTSVTRTDTNARNRRIKEGSDIDSYSVDSSSPVSPFLPDHGALGIRNPSFDPYPDLISPWRVHLVSGHRFRRRWLQRGGARAREGKRVRSREIGRFARMARVTATRAPDKFHSIQLQVWNSDVIEVGATEFMTPFEFIFLYEKHLFLTFSNRTVAVWNLGGELVASFEDLVIFYCKAKDIGRRKQGDTSGSTIKEALESVTALFYDEHRNEIYTGNKQGLVHVWSKPLFIGDNLQACL
ncbi:hypothetical protein BHE74_00057584, partial [Ensete ventricosum]